MPEQSALRRNGGADTTENAAEESGNSRGFALNVDLSACVGLPAYFRVWVRYNTPNHVRTMRWLGDHVRRSANIRGPFLMLVDKYLLPPNESLSLLRSSDSIRLACVENEWQRPFSYNNEPDYDPPSPPDDPVIENNTRKPPVEPQPSPQQHSSLPHTLSDNATIHTIFKTSPVSTTDSPSLVDENLQRVKRRALALLQQVTGEEQEQKGQDDVDAPKKRRRRVRRRRPARPISPFIDPTEPMSVSIESPASKSVNLTPSLPAVQSTPDASVKVSPTSDFQPQLYPTPDSIVAPSIPNTPRVTSLGLGTPSVCQTSEPLTSPSQSSEPLASPRQRSQPARSSTPTVLFAVEAAPAPVLRNQAATRAPRVVRALSAGPNDRITNASLCSTE